jgi:hypothetical protein
MIAGTHGCRPYDIVLPPVCDRSKDCAKGGTRPDTSDHPAIAAPVTNRVTILTKPV